MSGARQGIAHDLLYFRSKVCFLGHPAKRDSYPDERPNIDLTFVKGR